MKVPVVRMLLPLALLATAPAFGASTTLSASSQSDAYANIQSTLNSTIEVPDCAHSGFGPHITQAIDSELGKPVFVFHAHVAPDNDRCLKSDRQRNEIKVDAESPDGLKAFAGDHMSYRWLFRLDSGFLASPDFTHLHQIKPVGGDADMPLITLLARGGTAEAMELTHYDAANTRRVLASAPLQGFRGEWVEARETLTAGVPGQYTLVLRRLRDNAVLLSYSNASIDMGRSGNEFLRPKWGIYRSLLQSSYLRDEQLRYDQFCIAKGSDSCTGTLQAAAPTFGIAPGNYGQAQTVALATATPYATIRYVTGGPAATCSSGTVYASPLLLASTTTLSAIACKAGLADSGATTGTWTIATTPARFAITGSAVTASASDGNLPANTVDGSLATRWSANGKGQWIRYDMKALKTVSLVKLAWYQGSSRRYAFDLQVSADGKTYTTLFSGQSKGGTTALETVDFTDVQARYVRVVGQGNTANTWNSLTEVQVWGLN